MHALARIGRGRPVGWVLLAVVVIVAGYTSLWFGGTDVASVALTIGYLVLVPVALLARPVARDGDSE